MAKVKLCCYEDYLHFHRLFKDLIVGDFIPPLQNWEKWDGNFSKTAQEKE